MCTDDRADWPIFQNCGEANASSTSCATPGSLFNVLSNITIDGTLVQTWNTSFPWTQRATAEIQILASNLAKDMLAHGDMNMSNTNTTINTKVVYGEKQALPKLDAESSSSSCPSKGIQATTTTLPAKKKAVGGNKFRSYANDQAADKAVNRGSDSTNSEVIPSSNVTVAAGSVYTPSSGIATNNPPPHTTSAGATPTTAANSIAVANSLANGSLATLNMNAATSLAKANINAASSLTIANSAGQTVTAATNTITVMSTSTAYISLIPGTANPSALLSAIQEELSSELTTVPSAVMSDIDAEISAVPSILEEISSVIAAMPSGTFPNGTGNSTDVDIVLFPPDSNLTHRSNYTEMNWTSGNPEFSGP